MKLLLKKIQYHYWSIGQCEKFIVESGVGAGSGSTNSSRAACKVMQRIFLANNK